MFTCLVIQYIKFLKNEKNTVFSEILWGVFLFVWGFFCTTSTLKWPTNEMTVPVVAHTSYEFDTPALIDGVIFSGKKKNLT